MGNMLKRLEKEMLNGGEVCVHIKTGKSVVRLSIEPEEVQCGEDSVYMMSGNTVINLEELTDVEVEEKSYHLTGKTLEAYIDFM